MDTPRGRVSIVAWAAARVMLLVLLGSGSVTQADDDPSLSEAERAFFSWFDGLGLPDLARTRFVRFRAGQWQKQRQGSPQAFVRHGFLLRDEAGRFEVLESDLSVHALERRDVPDRPWESVLYEAADLPSFVAAGIAERRAGRDDPQRSPSSRVDPFLTHAWPGYDGTWRLAVLARACAAQGNIAAAGALFDLAYEERLDRELLEARKGMARELRLGLPYELVAAGRSDEDRVALLELWLRRFGDLEDGAAISADIEVLRSMIRERDARRAHPPRPLEAMEQEERIAEWAYRLHEVADAAWKRELDGTATGKEPDAALAALGLAAVPALVAALDDPRLTRGLLWNRRDRAWQRPVAHVQRVGDVALRVLQEISGWGIDLRGEIQPVGDSRRTQVREAALDWHRDVLARGEVAVLVERLQAGTWGAFRAAPRLIALDADAAARTLIPLLLGQAQGKAEGTWEWMEMQSEALRLLAKVPGPRASEALAQRLVQASGLRARVPLAVALERRGDRRGLDVLLEHWPRLLSTATAQRAEEPEEAQEKPIPPAEQEVHDVSHWFNEILDAFAVADDVRTIRVLRDYAALAEPRARLHLVIRFLAAKSTQFSDSGGSGYTAVDRAVPGPRSPDVEIEIERLLAGLLEDTYRLDGTKLEIDGVPVEPMVAELAAWALARRYPDRWQFDPAAPTAMRKRARRAAASSWRARTGQAPLAPTTDPPPVVIDGALQAELEGATQAATEGERERARAALEARGFGALAALRAMLASLAKDAPGRHALEGVANRLALEVREVVLDGAPLPHGSLFSRQLSALVGRRLSGELFTEAVLAFTQHRPPGVHGLRLRMQRNEEGRGARVVATIVEEPRSGGGNRNVWAHSGPWIRRGNETSTGGGGYSVRGYAESAEGWQGWARSIDEALVDIDVEEDLEVGGSVSFVP
jgi:hypothetical protein